MQHPFGDFDETGNEPGEHFEYFRSADPGRVDDGLDGPDVGRHAAVDVDETKLVRQVARQQDLAAAFQQIGIVGQCHDASAGKCSRLA